MGPTIKSTRRNSQQQSASTPDDAFAEIVHLARKGMTRQRYLAEVLRSVVRAFSSPYGALHVRYAAEVLQDDYHCGPDDPNFWKASLQEFLTESLTQARPRARTFQSRSGEIQVAFLSAPFYDAGGPAIGAIALVVPLAGKNDDASHLVRLESLCRMASFAAEFLAEPRMQRPRVEAAPAGCGLYESPQELAFAITNELRNRLSCEQVALGLVRGRRVRILSVSGLESVNKRGPGATVLTAAMEECFDAASPIVYPPPDTGSGSPPNQYHLHRQWHTQVKGDAVCSIPLRAGGGIAVILSLRFRSNSPRAMPAPEDIAARVEPYAATLVLTARATRSVAGHAVDAIGHQSAMLTRPGSIGRKITFAAAALAGALFLFGEMNFRVTAPSKVAATVLHHLGAPSAGVLVAAHVQPGDRVRTGQVLFEFDQRELAQELAELNAQIEVFQAEADRAVPNEDLAEARIAMANMETTRIRRDIVRTRFEQARVRSPVDGVVVQGDPRQYIGSVLPQGQPLLQIAPDGAWKIEVALPQWALRDVQAGMQGSFASFARPEARQEFQLTRVLPAAQIRDSENAIVAEAQLAQAPQWLKMGMEGASRIEVGSRPIWWVTLHRITDYLHIKFWL